MIVVGTPALSTNGSVSCLYAGTSTCFPCLLCTAKWHAGRFPRRSPSDQAEPRHFCLCDQSKSCPCCVLPTDNRRVFRWRSGTAVGGGTSPVFLPPFQFFLPLFNYFFYPFQFFLPLFNFSTLFQVCLPLLPFSHKLPLRTFDQTHYFIILHQNVQCRRHRTKAQFTKMNKVIMRCDNS